MSLGANAKQILLDEHRLARTQTLPFIADVSEIADMHTFNCAKHIKCTCSTS